MNENAQPLWAFDGGLKLEAHKQLSSGKPIVKADAVGLYVLPLQQHIGEPSELLVNIGDRVLKGQMIAQPTNIISASIHSPVSGTIKDIGPYPVPHPSGINDTCVVIENDFKEQWGRKAPLGDAYHQMTSHDLRKLIRDAGIVGLGGAAFPAAVKQTEINISTLIINGVECEPYISCDDALMRVRAREIISGADIIGHVIKARECIVAIEDNKPEAIDAMQLAIDEDGTGFFRIQVVPTIYPSGGEKQLIKVVTGKEVPVNALPADIDILCHNVGTAYAIHKAVYEDEPLISRIVTVTGHGVTQPQNLEVAIGTRMHDCIQQCGDYTEGADMLIMGGPMMGFALDNDQAPVVKATNCLLVTQREAHKPDTQSSHMPCIRCGLCVDVCPARLLPQQLYWYSSAREHERAIEYHLFDCIECGCCSYVCPSNIPLVQYYRFAKSEIWTQEAERKKSDIARERYEFRVARLEKQKQEREQRLRKKRELLDKKKSSSKVNAELDAKKSAIAEAIARVQEKKKARTVTPRNIDNLSPEQQKLIKAADRRREHIKQSNNKNPQ